ncbi:MAG: reactive intermediate/imine deaminase [Lysobacterales bacterium]|jgi:2-aminomuconate deaminase|nr:MAG: reactive intermediate/imine deaminase [Xanthomonadales bacterium]
MDEASILTPEAPPPIGAYPHARRVGPFVFLSGIGPRDPKTGEVPGNLYDSEGRLIAYDFEAQCRSVFGNVAAVLNAAGARLDQLIDVTVFLTRMEKDFPVFNRLYGEFFAGVRACRTTLGVNALPTPIAIELKCIAWLGER